MKTKTKAVRLDNIPDHAEQPTEFSALVVPGESITVYARRACGYDYSADWLVRPAEPLVFADSAAAGAWLASLTVAQHDELAGLFAAVNEHAASPLAGTPESRLVAADWVEENGGSRDWLHGLHAVRRHETVYRNYEQTYRVGDDAEHSSFNLHYLDPIEKITAKTVTFACRSGSRVERRRLTILDFCRRNYESVEARRRRNSQWTD